MSSTDTQYGALRDLQTSRFYMFLGVFLVHVAAYGLFANVMPEWSAVLGLSLIHI